MGVQGALKLAVIHDTKKPDLPSREILETIKNRGLTPVFLRISNLSSSVGDEMAIFYGKRRISKVDGAIVRSLGATVNVEQYVRRLTLLKEMEKMGVTIMNPVDGMAKARDKYEALSILSRAGLRVPKTIVTEDLGLAYDFAAALGKVVVKPLIGSRGYGSVLVDNPEIAFRIFKTLLSFNQVIYVQEYIDKKAYDVRVFVVDGEVLASIQRFITKPGEWRTNIAQGGRAKAYNPPDEVKEVAIKACEVLGLWYAGVDVSETEEGGYVIFEVNAAPDWQGLAEATGVRPAEAIVDTIIRKCKC
ncbi:MAG: RimK family alpha-L-glutamate ligase [Candidatus Nezhaarchaeota archaeon]|nr:RimK family alpha-L-glutamate ligase [Candidatus Nezhaarchaeota archaeon]